MTTITESQIKEHNQKEIIHVFFKKYSLGKALKKANVYKGRGVPAVDVALYLIQLVFTKKSMYMNILNGTHYAGFAKDVVYRFLNATFINWTTFLLQTALPVVMHITGLTSEERLNALIIDDTMYERLRSKKVELLANVHDHAAKGKNKFKRGFRLLTLGWSDGCTFIPMLFRHLSSGEIKNRYTEANPNIDKRSVGYKTRQQAVMSATDVLLSMLELTKKMLVPAKHVVFDSWFSFPSTMMRIHKIGFASIGRLKDTSKIKYLFGGEKKTLKQIYSSSPKRRGRSKYLLSAEVLFYNDKAETMPARIVFVRDRNNRSKWIAFGATDMELSEEQVIQLYSRRWDIEVFFKICKSYLNLANEFQGLSYDSVTAHTAIVMIRYLILATQKRQNEDPRSIGELFHLAYDEMAEINFSDAISIIFNVLREVLGDCLFLSDQQVNEIIDRFIDKLPLCFKWAFPPLVLLKQAS
jgi:hypothetical protein